MEGNCCWRAQREKGRPPSLKAPTENLAIDYGSVLCSLHWQVGMLLDSSGEKGAEMKAALLITVVCSSLPSQHYPQRRREAGPGLPTVCTRKEEISQRWKGMYWSVVVAQNKLLHSSQQITLFCNHSPLLPTHTDAFLSYPSTPP